MVCRWTPRDTCYHLASHGIFIAGVNERPDGDRSRCATATVTALKPIPRSQFSNEPDIAILVREPSILRHFSPVVSRRPGVVSYLDTSIGLIKKKRSGMYSRKTEQKKKTKKTRESFYSIVRKFERFSKTSKSFKPLKNSENAGLKLLDIQVKRFNGVLSLPLLFFCASDALPKKYRTLLLVYCFKYFDRRREGSDKASRPASCVL